MHQVLVAEVVQAAISEDLGASLEPHGLTEGDAALGQQLGGDAAQGAQHGPAGVDHLQLAVAAEGLGVGRQASGVPAVVAGELASQVRGGVALREGACQSTTEAGTSVGQQPGGSTSIRGWGGGEGVALLRDTDNRSY